MKPDLILIAEDSEEDVYFIRRSFERSGLVNPVFVVHDGEEAIAYLKGEGKFANRAEYPLPSLLLLDLKMPNKNGFEVLEWIRSDSNLKSLRVVVLTNSGMTSDINRAYRLGANSFMVKPVDKDQFFAITDAIRGYWLWMSEVPEMERPVRQVAGIPEAE